MIYSEDAIKLPTKLEARAYLNFEVKEFIENAVYAGKTHIDWDYYPELNRLGHLASLFGITLDEDKITAEVDELVGVKK